MNAPSLNHRLAHWVCDFSWEQIPPTVVEDIKLRILDLVGVMLGASLLAQTVEGILYLENAGERWAAATRAFAAFPPAQTRKRDPPSTANTDPLIYPARGDARNAARSATSNGSPIRPNGSVAMMWR